MNWLNSHISRLRRTVWSHSIHLLILNQKLHELVQINATDCANSLEKTRRFQKLKIGRCILAKGLHCPIFSCFMKSTFSPSAITETRHSDRIFGTATATDCANSADKSRKIGAKPSEQEFLVKGLHCQIVLFNLIRSISIVSASILRCSSPQNCIKLAKRTG